MQRIKRIFQILRYYNIGLLAFRAKYSLQKRIGLLKRKFPCLSWIEIELYDWLSPNINADNSDFLQVHKVNGRRFFFDNNNLPKLGDECQKKVITEAEDIIQNKFRYFSNKTYSLGYGPEWFLNPITGKRANSEIHWCNVKIFDSNVGDIKIIWEPSRFAWTYTLVRAFAATGNDKYVEKFWTLFESWLEANQPNIGPNYICGQECALRLMAMCFVYYAFNNVLASTKDRLTRLIIAIAVHADRIEKNINFAISTRTNHALSEAAALYTTGLLFPEFSRSDYWFKLGKKILTTEGLKQIYPDGSYLQNSMNYHRLMLHIFLWTVRLAQLNGKSFCSKLISRLKKATQFLYDMQDDVSGRVPNYGANDGALILPLNCCDYLDYRPVLQSMNYLLHNKKLYTKGPWDEDLIWLFGSLSVNSPNEIIERKSVEYPQGGYYILRERNSWAMIRCHTYQDRPTQADMLCLDLWWKGINLLRDSGSYTYFDEKPWQHYFVSTAAHNTIEVDGKDQMTKGPRFIWYDWTRSSKPLFEIQDENKVQIFSGSHFGYKRLSGNIIHFRSIASLLEGKLWIIVDDIVGLGVYETKLFWHLTDAPFKVNDNKIILETKEGLATINILLKRQFKLINSKGNEQIPAGFQSLYYGERIPAPTIIVKAIQKLPVRFISILTLGAEIGDLSYNEERISFETSNNIRSNLILDKPSFSKSVFISH